MSGTALFSSLTCGDQSVSDAQILRVIFLSLSIAFLEATSLNSLIIVCCCVGHLADRGETYADHGRESGFMISHGLYAPQPQQQRKERRHPVCRSDPSLYNILYKYQSIYSSEVSTSVVHLITTHTHTYRKALGTDGNRQRESTTALPPHTGAYNHSHMYSASNRGARRTTSGTRKTWVSKKPTPSTPRPPSTHNQAPLPSANATRGSISPEVPLLSKSNRMTSYSNKSGYTTGFREHLPNGFAAIQRANLLHADHHVAIK